MKKTKSKGQEKAQLKANRKKAEKAIKSLLISELTNLIGGFAEPSKKLKKLIEKSATAFTKAIDKTAKPIVESPNLELKETSVIADKKVAKPRTVKKTEKESKR